MITRRASVGWGITRVVCGMESSTIPATASVVGEVARKCSQVSQTFLLLSPRNLNRVPRLAGFRAGEWIRKIMSMRDSKVIQVSVHKSRSAPRVEFDAKTESENNLLKKRIHECKEGLHHVNILHLSSECFLPCLPFHFCFCGEQNVPLVPYATQAADSDWIFRLLWMFK